MKYLVQRTVYSLVSLLLLFIFLFVLLRLVPGDPAQQIAGVSATQEQVEAVRERLGLAKPIPVQLSVYFQDILQGDVGTSIRTGEPVMSRIAEAVPATVLLMITGLGLAVICGIALGAVATRKRDGVTDGAISLFAIISFSIPSFVLALLLIDMFAIQLGWLPSSGYQLPVALILPTIAMAITQVGVVIRISRNGILEASSADYIRTAIAKGLPERIILRDHALRNALPPVITVVGLQVGNLVAGSVVIETIFRWPGAGRLLIDSVLARDYPMIQGLVLVFGILVIIANLVVDLANASVDPRVRDRRVAA